jgi:hypothetical protein
MTNFNLNLSTADEIRSKSITFKPSTATPFITPVFEGSSTVVGIYTPLNNVFTGLGNSVEFHTSSRPGGGQLYPRGNQ